MQTLRNWVAVAAFGMVVGGTTGAAGGPGNSGTQPASSQLTFEKQIRPIFKTYCLDCHGGGDTLQAKLDLRLRRFAVKGGQSGAAIVPGDPTRSLLLKRVRSGTMPPSEKKVPAEQIALLERWIAAGAPTGRTEPVQLPTGVDITPEERAYWFYQPVRSPSVPAFKAADRVRTPIDAFVLRRLRERGLSFAPEADRLTLIKRVAFDLTGLPPSPADLEAFLADPAEGAYERMVDRLLASPHYGERWGRHWLDVAGYADSDGNGNDDTLRPYAYKYRDYVIRSLNADKPLSEFVIEQLAGDELVSHPRTNLRPEQIELLTATGFLRTAVDATASESDPTAAANQVVADTVKIVSSSMLGLTVGCAQCHDHKYDPIPQSDYFRLRAVFEPALDPAHWRKPSQRLVSLYTPEQRAQAAAVDAEVSKLQATFDVREKQMVDAALEQELLKHPAEQRAALREAVRTPADRRNPEQKQLVATNPSLLITPGVLYQYNAKAADELNKERGQINARRAQKPVEDFVSILDEPQGSPPVTRVHYRGDYRQPKQEVGPGDLTIAAPEGRRLELPSTAQIGSATGRRLAWARNLVSGSHPLFGRVMANRIWMHHFGRGLVDTPGDFGRLGTSPTHPELLDWLAAELPRRKWSLKQLHRLILTSTVYRQGSVREPEKQRIDGDGSLYSRYPVRRLDAEALRDRLLVTVGRLDRTQFGPPVALAEDAVGQVAVQDDRPRRSVYLQVRRTKPVSFLSAFDAPVITVNCEKRMSSTVAPQALMLMNSDFVLKQAGFFAERLRKECPPGLPYQISLAWQLAFQRPVSPEELEQAIRFVHRQREQQRAALGDEKSELAALTNLCQQLLSSNEFLYVD